MLRAIPLDPGQALAIGAERGRRIEISAFGQHVASTIGQGDADQAMRHRRRAMRLLNGQHGMRLRVELQVAEPAIGSVRQRAWRGAQRLPVQLLIGLVDEDQALLRQAERATAVFVDPAAHRHLGGRQACTAIRRPVPQARARIRRVVLQPHQAAQTGAQLGEIAAGGRRLRARPGALPESVRCNAASQGAAFSGAYSTLANQLGGLLVAKLQGVQRARRLFGLQTGLQNHPMMR